VVDHAGWGDETTEVEMAVDHGSLANTAGQTRDLVPARPVTADQRVAEPVNISSTSGEGSLSRQAIPRRTGDHSSTRVPRTRPCAWSVGAGLRGEPRWCRGGHLSGALARDRTSAISWSPNSLFSIRLVRRSEVKRNPALMANPMARPMARPFGAGLVIQLGATVLNRLIYGDLDHARRHTPVLRAAGVTQSSWKSADCGAPSIISTEATPTDTPSRTASNRWACTTQFRQYWSGRSASSA
jgi:hypothetical protein